ncbi:MAG: hypothetical protein HKN68_16420 [Saprospiraceae bacterium]|nr:hypothetical protein [Saprospiraceae bacterium]
MKKFINKIFSYVIIFLVIFPASMEAYPIDGFVRTGIKRLLRLERIEKGEIKDKLPPTGALLRTEDIKLSLLDHTLDQFPTIDAGLDGQLQKLFPNLHESYSVALLDYSDPENIRYAERQANRGFQPGSVGKLAVVTGLFCELEDLYPDDFQARINLLKNKKVRAGYWAIPNIHTVPFFNPDNNKLDKRLLVEGDVFSLFEWVDHMLSVSSNGAASVVWREIILMRHFGDDYPQLDEKTAEAYFSETSRKELSDIAVHVVNQPLRDLGIGEDEWRLGTFFTRGATNKVPPQGGSIGTPRGMLKWLWALESGRIIDKESSLEIKRLMYMTDRRIRYAANPALSEAAVYFKSGSLYKCKEEPGYTCEKYKGNVNNYMNSVAMIEFPGGRKYMVALMTNVLRKNSNSDHNALASRIDQLIK